MAHDLLIRYEINVEDRYRELLKPNEVVRGESGKLTLYVTNLGKEKFPGGIIKELTIEYGIRGLRGIKHSISVSPPPRCPELNPNETQTLPSVDLFPAEEGTARLVVKLEAEDKQSIKFYQNPTLPLGESEWYHFFYVVNREHVLEIMLLKQLLERKS